MRKPSRRERRRAVRRKNEPMSYAMAWAEVGRQIAIGLQRGLRTFTGEPLQPHYVNGKRRQRNHRGKLPKMSQVPYLQPKWRAMQRQKNKGLAGVYDTIRPDAERFAGFRADMETIVDEVFDS